MEKRVLPMLAFKAIRACPGSSLAFSLRPKQWWRELTAHGSHACPVTSCRQSTFCTDLPTRNPSLFHILFMYPDPPASRLTQMLPPPPPSLP